MIDFKKYNSDREELLNIVNEDCSQFEHSNYILLYMAIENDLHMIAELLFDMRKEI